MTSVPTREAARTAPRGEAPSRSGPLWSGSSMALQLWVLTLRQLRIVYADHRIILAGIAQPLIMLTLFSQIFGSMATPAMLPRQVDYIDFLLPALLVTTGIGMAQGAGVGLLRDIESGMVRRFRVLPLTLMLTLVARSLADLTRSVVHLVILIAGASLLFGYSYSGGVRGLVGAALLSLVVIWSLIWIFIALAVWLRKVDVLASVGFFVSFPLMFASSAFVPTDILPGWLGAVARVNPVTYAVEGSRHLALGWEPGGAVAAALVSSIALIVVLMTVSAWAFTRKPEA
ncbi:ABC transporter permease [Streptomyces sp. NPDC059209]|uniref:ABC transporter permease n=1 Tax=Streptomyces sp. NPDC059209 TaxID=3346769 RepID=UPI00369083D4